MNNKLLTVCLLAGLAATLNACDEGEYNELKCDNTYVADCLDATHMMTCQNGTLTVSECPVGKYCSNTITDASGVRVLTSASCVSASGIEVIPTPNCNHAEPVCNGASVETCINGEPILTACNYGCENGACNAAPAACTATVCKDATTLSVCNNGVATDQVCENGCENGACKTAPVVSCTVSDTRCGDGALQICTGESWVSYQNCPFGCGSDKECLTAACTASVCLDDNRVSVCDPATGIATDSVCENGCENGACKAASGCTDGTMKCADNAMSVCAANTWIPTGTVCENGCNAEGTDCASASGCTDGTMKCADNAMSVCAANTWLPTGTVCENGCNAEGTDCASAVVSACDGVVCDEGECILGVCVTEEMKALKDGDPCDSGTFVEFCNGDKMVYCGTEDDENYSVYIDDCSEDGGCGVIDYYGDKSLFLTWCKEPNSCSAVDEKQFSCYLYESPEGDFNYETFSQCYQTTDGALVALPALYTTGAYGVCDGACDAASEHCADPVDPYYCDYTTRCNGSSSYDYCYDLSIFGVFSGSETCTGASQCVTVDGYDTCRNACDTLGAVTNSCYLDSDPDFGDTHYAVKSTCSTATNGSLYDDEFYTECAHSCADGACQMITEKEGKACNDEDYLACDTSDIIEYCDYNDDEELLYVARSCSSYYGEEYICVDNGQESTCAMSCDNVGEQSVVCEDGWFGSYTVTYKCTENARGVKYLETVAEEDCEGNCNKAGTACE